MARSFLNIITFDEREIRVAEFGFFADSPSFDGDTVIFRHGGKYERIDLASGMLTSAEKPSAKQCHGIYLRFTSEIRDGIGYCEMVINENEADERVLVRFMGCKNSIGDVPLSDDGKRIVFFGYPANEFGN